MNSLLSPTNLMVDRHHQSPPTGDVAATVPVVPPASTSTIEECRKRLVPVLAASAQTRDPGRHLASEQYLQLLSDDKCQNFFRQAKDMRHQLLSLVSQESPVSDGNGCLKRSRVDEVDAWVRSTRGRFDSDANMSIASDAATVVSRTDSDITFVDGAAGGAASRKWPPNLSPHSQAILRPNNWLPYSAEHVGAPPGQALPLVASPVSTITQDLHHTPGASELFQQSLNMYPALVQPLTGQPKTEPDTHVQPGPAPTGPAEWSLGHSDQEMEIAATTTSPSSSVTDYVSHRPTEPGIWFRQRGTQYKEIVNIDIEVNDEIFYVTKDGYVPSIFKISPPAPAIAKAKLAGDAPSSIANFPYSLVASHSDYGSTSISVRYLLTTGLRTAMEAKRPRQERQHPTLRSRRSSATMRRCNGPGRASWSSKSTPSLSGARLGYLIPW